MKRYIQILGKFIEDKNLVPKLGSILLAVILWAYISTGKSGDVRFKLPLTYAGLEENYVVSKASHKFVVVEVQGNKDDLKNISSKNIKLVVDLSTAEKDEYKPYKIQYQKIDFTDDFKIELYPEDVKILIEKKIERNVRIVPRYSGSAEKGFKAGRIRLNPEYVKISGPASVVNSIGVVYTEEIPVDDKNSAFRQDIRIEKVNEDSVEYSLSKVNAIVPILNFSMFNSVETASVEIPVTLRNKKKGYKYSLTTDKVKVNVILPENKSSSERFFSAYVDADEIEIDNDAFIKKNKIEVMGFVHVVGDTSETDSGILSATPDSIEIVVTKE